MFFPSERVYHEMRSETASLWYVSTSENGEEALLVKAPTTSIKSLISGCKFGLAFARKGNHLCNGIHIYDIPDHALLISGIQLHREEQLALVEGLHKRKFNIFLFNELDICVAWTSVSIESSDAHLILQTIGDKDNLYIGPFDDSTSSSLDDFCYSVSEFRSGNPNIIEYAEISPIPSAWMSISNHFIGLRETHLIDITNQNEGELFERTIWASLESVFPTTLYKSPQVEEGNTCRELTDILAAHEYGAFLFESKDLSVFQAGFSRGKVRRIAGVKKQIKKAITQLIGASKRVRNGNIIRAADGKILPFERNKKLHCIVLITEQIIEGDWTEIGICLSEAMISTGDFYHILDFGELIRLLKGSRGDAKRFDYNLIKRCEYFSETGDIRIQSRIM